VSLAVLAVAVGALTACQGPTPAAGNPLSSLVIGGPSPAEYCQVARQSLQQGMATMNRLGNMSQADISQAVDEAVAHNKRMTESAPSEIRHDYEIMNRLSEKSIKAMKGQMELANGAASNDPAARNAAIAAANSPDVTAAANDVLVEALKPEIMTAAQHIADYNRTHCGIDLPGPKDIDRLLRNLSDPAKTMHPFQDAPATGDQPIPGAGGQ
jgi:hypothetical protein